jgi:hypothetical protein
MNSMTLEAHLSAPVDIDLCTNCQAFWFDKYESLKLAPGSTLKLIKLIGEHSASGKPTLPPSLRCPRCATPLLFTHDMQRSTRFTYWRCDNGHGRFIGFFDFLREKDFIRPLSPQQLDELRRNVQTVNCSNCGASIDLASVSACSHCGSPISMLDMKHSERLLNQLQQAAEPRPIDPTLPMDLARARHDIERLFGAHDTGTEWWSSVSSSGLVEAGLSAIARWLTKSGIS